ncbi:hypothetical protein [Azospirillum sp.]|uniref:hypothetical protein n=1 Tax=Azospirillum sp. TaxID=34012 RepID=UPI002D6C60FF|nr:hypothetical protein [Azospirillum sp.]HYD69632.1 hypothetical protein [Azospirillum sp.]
MNDRHMPEPKSPFTDALKTPPDDDGRLLKRPEKDKARRGGTGETPDEGIATPS